MPVRRLLMSCAMVGFLVSWTIDARSESILSAEIGPQPLAEALTAFARQTGLQFIYVSDLATARQSKGVRAGLSPVDALTQLLDGTGLTFELLNARTVKIFAASPAATPVARTTRRKWRTTPGSRPTERIVVTAPRSVSAGKGHLIPFEDVRIVPASVTVLDGDSLAAQKLDQITDYATFIPGLSLDTAGVPSSNIVILRGISPVLGDASSVVYYMDDTPLGASSGWGYACCISLDLMALDLERLEVLRGPQGTRFGATSQSGTLRYVFKEPSLSRFEARVGADVSTTYGAGNAGTSIQAVVNAPIVDELLAVRVNAYDSYIPGYIDNAYTGAKDVNDLRRNGGRIVALWRPSEPLSMKVTAFWNRLSAESLPEVSSAGISTVPNTGDAYVVKASRPFGDLVQNRAFLQPWRQSLDSYSATVHWNAGSIEIGSATAWSSRATKYSLDFGAIPAGLLRFDREIGLEKFTEELRIASPRGHRVEWTLGAFYNHESVTDQNISNAFDTSYRPIADPSPEFDPFVNRSTFDETALYGNMTWKISDHLDLTTGIRYDHNDQEFLVSVRGVPVDAGQDSDGVTTWAAAVRYRVTPDVMLYGSVATGSQPGISTGSSFSGAEKLTSYEVGWKSEFMDHKALLDVSLFYIDWADIQVPAFHPFNAGKAKSEGGELVGSYSPLPGLNLGFIAAFTQCELTELVPAAAFILTGYQLAQVPKWSMTTSADYEWLISNTWHAHVGGSLRWIGRQWGLLVQSRSLGGAPTLEKPSYSVLDLNVGIAKDRLAIKVFARNVLDRRAALHNNLIGDDSGVPTQAEDYILQPRTIGVGFEFSL